MLLTLKTERLILHEITEEDFDFIIKLETRPENKKYETGGIPSVDNIVKKSRWYMENAKNLPNAGGVRYIVRNEKNEAVGIISLTCNWEIIKEWEIGYAFLSEYWGNGYASEAVKKVLDFAFEELHIHKIMAFINSENSRSVSLAKRVGMFQEGQLREARLINGEWNDESIFSMLKNDREQMR